MIREELKIREDQVVTLMPWKHVDFSVDDSGYSRCPIEECVAVAIYSEHVESPPSYQVVGSGDPDEDEIHHEVEFTRDQVCQVAQILRDYGFRGGVTLSKSRKTYNIWRNPPGPNIEKVC